MFVERHVGPQGTHERALFWQHVEGRDSEGAKAKGMVEQLAVVVQQLAMWVYAQEGAQRQRNAEIAAHFVGKIAFDDLATQMQTAESRIKNIKDWMKYVK